MKRIKSLRVKDSSFFEENFTLNLSERLNCLMGGRGTGKSTLLYFIQGELPCVRKFTEQRVLSILKIVA